MNETFEERAKRLGLAQQKAGQETFESRAKRLGLNADDTVEVNASYPERLATTILQGAQVIPGMKSLEALAGSIGSKFTDHPVSYTDAKAGLEEQTDRMGTGRKILSQAVSSPVLAPVMGLRGVAAMSPAMQGGAYGAADALLDVRPDESTTSRILRPIIEGTAGAALAGTSTAALKLIKSPAGTTKKVIGEAVVPNKVQRAVKAWRSATTPPVLEKPVVRLNDASAPKVEGLMSNAASIGSEPVVLPLRRPAGAGIPIRGGALPAEAASPVSGAAGMAADEQVQALVQMGVPVEKAQAAVAGEATAAGAAPRSSGLVGDAVAGRPSLEQRLAEAKATPRASRSPEQESLLRWKNRRPPGATRERDAMWAEKIAGWKADPTTRPGYVAPPAGADAPAPSLEDLLSLSLEHIKQGGSMGALNTIRNAIKP